MSDKFKKVLAVIILIVLVCGWYVTLWGIPGVMNPVKDKIQLGLDIKGGVYVVLEAQDTGKYSDTELSDLMDQTKAVIENRVDQLGLANPTVSVEGKNRIRVELPGADDASEAIKEIGKTAQLKFTMADQSYVLDGGAVKDATSGQSSESTGYVVNLEFDSTGAKAFEKATTKALAGTVTPTVSADMCEDKAAVDAKQVLIWLDNQVISHPSVNSVISGGKCEISGNFTQDEASELAALIRGGSLPLEMQEIESSSQTAKIGINALNMSILAGIIGVACILIIMLLGYRIMGVAADIALALYVILIIAAMAVMGSVLTLPGIAGIILSIGMAVDANVIIFTRIKEEIVDGRSIRVAVQTGYKRAVGTVIDSQVTTLIAAVILYQIGTSSVKGFAWTLMLGIIFSIITAVFVTQIYLSIIAGSKKFAKNKFFGIKKNGEPSFHVKKQFSFIKHRKIYYIISIVIILSGMIVGGVRGFSYGIDFTGGTMLHLDMGKKVSSQGIKEVMKGHNIETDQMEIVYAGDGNKEAIIKTNESLDNKERQSIINDMKDKYNITNSDVLASEHFGASVGKELKKNAIEAILLAALGMLIYIRIRFRQWKFGAASLLGVLHDVLIVCAFYAIFRVTVNNPFIAAILTVVGYSINDTIVIFDRVRENQHFMKRGKIEEILDKSINQTLSRSIMTSATTLIVMIPMYVLTSSSIREFTLPLMIGIATGCLSSIFVCSPLYYEFSKGSHASKYERQQAKALKEQKKLAAETVETSTDVEEVEENEIDTEVKDAKVEKEIQTDNHSGVEGVKGHKKKSRKQRKSEKN